MIDFKTIKNYILRKYVFRNQILTRDKERSYQFRLTNESFI